MDKELLRSLMVLFPPEVMSLILSFNDKASHRDAARRIARWWRSAEYRRLGWMRRYSNFLREHYYVHTRLGLSQWDKPTSDTPFSPDHISDLNYASPYATAAKRVRSEYLSLWFDNRTKRLKIK